MSEQSVIKSKVMIDMVSKNPIEDGAVIFEDGLITLSGNYEKIKNKIRPDAKIYDYNDCLNFIKKAQLFKPNLYHKRLYKTDFKIF